MSLDRVALIAPKEIRRISYLEFNRNFSELLVEINNGVIFQVYGNPHVMAMMERYVRPNSKNPSYFREQNPDFFAKQDIQKALFKGIAHPERFMIDSYVRLRRVEGDGTPVGPHIDAYEGASPESINFWVAFTDLAADDSLIFLQPKWHEGCDITGLRKRGVFSNIQHRWVPDPEVLADAVSASIQAGEYFVWQGGRMVHMGPWQLGQGRLTVDQRLFPVDGKAVTFFSSLPTYYNLQDIDRFDGRECPNQTVKTLWNERYATQYDWPYCRVLREKDAQSKAARVSEEIKNGLSPYLALRFISEYDVSLPDSALIWMLDCYARSVTLRVQMLPYVQSAQLRLRIVRELAVLPQETPLKTIRAVIKSGEIATFVRALPWTQRIWVLIVARISPYFEKAGLNRFKNKLEKFISARFLCASSRIV